MLYVDLETYAALDLKKVGVYAYAEDPTFEILMAAWSIDGQEPDIAIGEDEIRCIPGLFDPEVIKVAHNAEFERVCLANLGPTPPETWIDTMAIAAENGLPQSLEMLAKRLRVDPKDPAGSALIRLFTRPGKGGKRTYARQQPEKWMEFLAYCLQDVRTLVLISEAMGLRFPTETEEQLFLADQAINGRGVKLDVELAERAWEAGAQNAVEARARLKEITGLDNPNSVQQLLPWLREAGSPLPNLQAETVQDAIDDPDTSDVVREVLELRQGAALIAAQKFEVALRQMNTDGRLRGQFRFYGAHTGRWAGRGVQLHNLPRATVSDPEEAILDLKLGNGASAHTLKALVRGMIVGPLAVCDYSAIEARVLAWLAGEEWVLEAFRSERDIYVETAERMSTPGNQLSRFQGKVAVLALGYQGALKSLQHMGAQGTDDELYTLVRQWRAANPEIVRFWRLMENSWDNGVRARHINVRKTDSTTRLVLPSGRALTYRWVRNTSFLNSSGRMEVSRTFSDTNGNRVETYGGRLTENVTQAVARDVLGDALIRLEREGIPVVGHVHDEILAETTDLAAVQEIMCQPPPWAPDLPLDAKGFTTMRYRKD